MLAQLRVPFFTILFIFLFLFLFTKILGPIPFSVSSITTTKTDLFSVSGEGEATAIPDTAQMNLGITKTGKTVEDAQSQVNEVMNTIVRDLKTLGVDEKNIKTTNYSVNPAYDFDSGRQTVTGYTVSQDVSMKVMEIAQANKALDIATARGANNIGGITFTLHDETREKLEEKARKMAIDDAKKKAESISRESGVRLGRIVNVSVSDNPHEPIPYARSLEVDQKADVVPQTELSPGENTVRVTVSLSYETL